MRFKNPATVGGVATAVIVGAVAVGVIGWAISAGASGNADVPRTASTAPSATTSAPPVTSTITVDNSNPPETFAPPPADAAPALTAQQAADAYVEKLGHSPVDIPSGVSVSLGSLTIPVGPDCGTDCERGNTVVNGIAYSALNELAYGYEGTTCPAGSNLPADQCTNWMFLDANTGNLIIEIGPPMSARPNPSPSATG